MAHEGAPDNPQDHKHSDYEAAWFGVLLSILALGLAFCAAIGLSCEVDRFEERIEQQEERLCAVADDKAACLADLLEERR